MKPDALAELNKLFADMLGSTGRTKGTSTYYIAGAIGNRKFCYTRAKTGYKGRWGFWSWVQIHYKNGKILRTKFAKSGSKKKSQARAYRLLNRGVVK
jgi:hypothetical protein